MANFIIVACCNSNTGPDGLIFTNFIVIVDGNVNIDLDGSMFTNFIIIQNKRMFGVVIAKAPCEFS